MPGRIGGAILLLGGAVTLVAVAIGLMGGSVMLVERTSPPQSVGELATLAAVTLYGLGTLVVGISGASPFESRGTRIGFGVLGLGLMGMAANTIITNMLGVFQESWPILVLLVSLAAVAFGPVLAGISALRRPGPSRVIGVAMLLYPLLAVTALTGFGGVLPVLLVPASLTGVGAIVVRGARRASQPS